MIHLSGLDAMFLHVESAEMPMHVGALHVLSVPEEKKENFFNDVMALISDRLHLSPVFTRKLANIPFDLSNPVWVEDEYIDLEEHIHHITLPKPGSNRLLQRTVARLHSSLLDRSRPLWEFYIIDGLKSGEVALFTKLHHSAIDGQGGIDVGKVIFDTTEKPRKTPKPRTKLRKNQYQLGVAELMTAAILNGAQQSLKVAKLAPEFFSASRNIISNIRLTKWRKAPSLLKPSRWTAPRTPVNVSITNQRSFSGRTVPLSEVKQIAKAFNVTLNDVVLATISGTLRRYWMETNELPSRSMRAAVPVSLRPKGDNTANNQISMLPIDLVSSEADPVSRLLLISKESSKSKESLAKYQPFLPVDFPVIAAPWLISGAASLYGRSRMADWIPPITNLVISNVPGVSLPLYFAGSKVLSFYPVSIPIHGMALNVTVTSYNGRMDYGLIACRRALPDLNEMGNYLLDEHRILLESSSKASNVA